MTAFGQLPVVLSDTVCYPRKTAVKLTERALQANVYKQQRDSLIRDVTTLSNLIEIKNIEINNFKENVELYKKTIASFESQIKNMNDQRQILQLQADNLNKLYKKEKRRKTFFKITTLLGIAAGAYLGTKL